MTYEDITYCPLFLPVTPEDIAQMLKEIRNVAESLWFWNEFRGCQMLPLLNRGGHTDRKQIAQARARRFEWTAASAKCIHTQQLIERFIFPWMGGPSRVTVLRMQPGAELLPHIDCADEEVGTLQHKFRIVLNGKVSDLYFLDASGSERIFVKNAYAIYTLDGGHPHGSVNSTSEVRYTLCIASPWRGQNLEYQRLLDQHRGQALRLQRPAIRKEWCDIQRLGYKGESSWKN